MIYFKGIKFCDFRDF